MKKMPLLIQINHECLSVIQESDILPPEQREQPPQSPLTKGELKGVVENLCCERMKKADYLVLPSLGIAHINLNFCPCCGKKIERGCR